MHIGACYAALGQFKEAKQQLQTALMAGLSLSLCLSLSPSLSHTLSVSVSVSVKGSQAAAADCADGRCQYLYSVCWLY